MKTKKSNLKNIINISFIFVLTIGIAIYMLKVDGIDNIVNVIKNVNIYWMFAGIACMVMYWLIESLNLYIISKTMYKDQLFINSFRVSMIGQLFNSITPFSSGGQPMQAVSLVKEGKRISDSANILLIKFIVYQATLVLYTLVIIIFQFSYFKSLVSNFMNLALVGFLVNFAVIVFLVLIGVNKNIVLNASKIFFKLLARIKIVKNPEERMNKLEKSIDNFHANFKMMKKQKMAIFEMVVLSLIQHTVFFSVTYMVYRAFGLSGVSLFKIISAQSFLSMVMAFVPIPGAGIAAEGGFLIIFKNFFTPQTINMGILFWRLYTFYLPIIIGSIVMIMVRRREKVSEEIK